LPTDHEDNEEVEKPKEDNLKVPQITISAEPNHRSNSEFKAQITSFPR
jgi:hypothetical protein